MITCLAQQQTGRSAKLLYISYKTNLLQYEGPVKYNILNKYIYKYIYKFHGIRLSDCNFVTSCQKGGHTEQTKETWIFRQVATTVGGGSVINGAYPV